ncbi:hypothetical protein Tasa_012_031 [Tanticharoenia sakaeratensis NBRC 103193]|uniref:Uncharacterized protein n=1 Tax=Tanticharoenia sakaeratensis NBRC 103193 TaxID=1231623 RepID=A0A0D6MK88_9PROT|nr:hypothetical protein Tasa_012_031 [Tanticharoenia sakaeratensis NBRC 103193]GBQ25089.1 hypothetical protein AA103193_2962 [Tanticharoenia sakaeratensis NBRC 103193]
MGPLRPIIDVVRLMLPAVGASVQTGAPASCRSMLSEALSTGTLAGAPPECLVVGPIHPGMAEAVVRKVFGTLTAVAPIRCPGASTDAPICLSARHDFRQRKARRVRNGAARFLSADLPYRDGRLAVIDSTLAVGIDGERCDDGSDPGDLTFFDNLEPLRNFAG